MKNRNNQLTAILFVVALALAPMVQAGPKPDGGPTRPPPANDAPTPDGGPTRPPPNEAPTPDGGPSLRGAPTQRAHPTPAPHRTPVNLGANEGASANSANSEAIPEGENEPVITVHATDSVTRGKTGSFVLDMHPLMLGGLYVNFSLSGSAVAGLDYVQPLSPAYIGQAGYGAILIQTLRDPRGGSSRQAYSVVVTLEAGAGYWLGQPGSATMWIKP